MRNAIGKRKSFIVGAVVIGLMNVSSLSAAEKSWEDDTVLVSPQGDQTVVQAFKGKKVLFKNADPQLAIEWGMANARTTVVLAGQYVVSDVIDVPREDVTLIIAEGAELSHNREYDDKATTLPLILRGRGGGKFSQTSHLWPLIWNRGHDNFSMLHFGKITRQSRVPGKPGEVEKPGKKDVYGIMFDGRNDKNTCGIKGGMLVQTGPIDQCIWLVDCSRVQLPLAVQNWSSAGVLSMEGCEDCSLGLIVNLAAEPGGGTGEVADLNGHNKGITIERLIGERSGEELLDCNASEATVGEIVAIGTYNKIATLSQGCGRRFTTRPRPPKIACDVKQETKLADYASVTLKNEVPKMPDALPYFTVKSTVEVTMTDGSKKTYTRKTTIDVR